MAREELIRIAEWFSLTTTPAPHRHPHQTDQALIDELALKVFNGKLILVEIIERPEPEPGKLVFHNCCLDSLKKIDENIKKINIIGILLCVGNTYRITGSHPGLPAVAGMISNAYNAKQMEWDVFAGAMKGLSELKRNQIRTVSRIEIFKRHDFPNYDRELNKFWTGVYEATYV